MAKYRLTSTEVILCVWRDWKAIVYYELLPPGKTNSSDYNTTTTNKIIIIISHWKKNLEELVNRKASPPIIPDRIYIFLLNKSSQNLDRKF